MLILIPCLLTLAGMQTIQTQPEDYSYHPVFMENFWGHENLYTQMKTNQLLATQSGKSLITAYEKKGETTHNTDEKQPYNDVQAYEKLSQLIKNKNLEQENKETRILMSTYARILVMSGRNAESWKMELKIKNDKDYDEYGQNIMEECERKSGFAFYKDHFFISQDCYGNEANNCHCKTITGKWRLSGALLELSSDHHPKDKTILHIWFRKGKLYAMDENFDQTFRFSRSSEVFLPDTLPDPDLSILSFKFKK